MKQQQDAVLTFSRQKHHHTYVYMEKCLDEALANKSKPTRSINKLKCVVVKLCLTLLSDSVSAHVKKLFCTVILPCN